MRKIYQNPFIAVFICILILGLGIKNFLGLPVSLYPNTSQPVFKAAINYNNISLEDFRDRYGKKIESALSGIENVSSVEGFYKTTSVDYRIYFNWETDDKKAKLDLRSTLAGFSSGFPEDWGDFWVAPWSSQNSNIYVALSSNELSEKELSTLIENRVLGSLQSIEGLEEASIWQTKQEYLRIELQPSLMESRGVTAMQIRKALLEKRYDKNLGEININGSRFDIILPLKEKTVADFQKIIVHMEKGEPYYLEDFAKVSFETKYFNHLFKANGQTALVAYGAVKNSGNISFVANEYIRLLSKAVEEMPGNVKMTTLLDPSTFIEEAIQNVFVAIFLGILIATLVIFLFLGSFIQTFVVTLSIPLSVLGGFSLMSLLGIEINLISLGALALSVGMVVDGAIVVLENISRHLKEKEKLTRDEKIEVIWESVAEVRPAVVASLLTTIIVFAPLAFTAPIANAILGDLARVMVCVLVISVLVTLFLIPPYLLLFKDSNPPEHSRLFGRLTKSFGSFIDLLTLSYQNTLRFFIRNKKTTNLSFVVLFILILFSVYILSFHVKRELIAKPETDKISFSISNQIDVLELEDMERLIAKEVESVVERDLKPYLSNYFTQVHKRWGGHILFTLKNKSMQEEFTKLLEEKFVNSARMRYSIYPWNPTSLEVPSEPLFKILVSQDGDKNPRSILTELSDVLSASDLVGNIDLDPSPNKRKYFEYNIDQEKIKRLEKSTDVLFFETLASSLETYINDILVYPLSIGKNSYDIKMMYPKETVRNLEDFKNIIFKIKDKYYPLRHFAYFEEKEQNAQFFSKDGRELYQVIVWPKNSYKGSLEEKRKEVLKVLEGNDKINLKSFSFLETGKEINESLRSLFDSLLIALALILLVLVLQFGTFQQTFIIMIAIPLGLIGVAGSLYAFSSTLSLNSMLGLILLSGTAVNNSILLTDFFNRLKNAKSLTELENSIVKASALRLRPILITTLTTILGMLPMAFAFDAGGKVLQPLGISVCGGLGVSTFLTLFVIPLVLYRVEARKCQ